MQFNVPQFTEVEDRVIGPLTVRQFLILLGAGGLTFLGYSASQNIPGTVIIGIVVFTPALILAFGQFNGRHLYRIIPVFVAFATLPKRYVFQKEVRSSGTDIRLSQAKANKQLQAAAVVDADRPDAEGDVHSRLRLIEYQLRKREERQRELVEQVK